MYSTVIEQDELSGRVWVEMVKLYRGRGDSKIVPVLALEFIFDGAGAALGLDKFSEVGTSGYDRLKNWMSEFYRDIKLNTKIP